MVSGNKPGRPTSRQFLSTTRRRRPGPSAAARGVSHLAVARSRQHSRSDGKPPAPGSGPGRVGSRDDGIAGFPSLSAPLRHSIMGAASAHHGQLFKQFIANCSCAFQGVCAQFRAHPERPGRISAQDQLRAEFTYDLIAGQLAERSSDPKSPTGPRCAREVLAAAEQVTERHIRVERRPKQNEPEALVADSSRIRDALGWRPTRSSLRRIITDAWAALDTPAAPGR
jgi:hypothetical protein